MEKTSVKVTFAGNPITLVGKEAKVGQPADDFTVLSSALKPVKLSDYAGKVKIISVFPSVDTSVCSAQNHRFNKEASTLSNEIQIIGISNDLPFALGRYCGAEGIDRIVTLSDHKDVDFGMKYGFLIQELRLLTRGVVVLDKNNIIRYVEYVPEVTHEPNYDAAIKAAKDLV